MPYNSCRYCDFTEEQLHLYIRAFRSALRKSVDAFRPDVIHANHLWLAASQAKSLFPDIPVVASCHGTDLRQFRNCPDLQEEVLAGCHHLDAALALSSFQQPEISSLYGISPERIPVTGIGYNDQIFYPSKSKADGPVRVLYAGKLCRAKGLPWLLEAFLRLDQECVLDIAGGGSGSEFDAIIKVVEGSSGRIQYHGQISQVQLSELMRAAHVFVLPSFFEGLPLVLAEALACGCRLVATALPGVRELFAGQPEAVIRQVILPAIRSQLEPEPDEESEFTRRLESALRMQVEQAASGGSLPECANVLLKHLRWSSVFQRVNTVYKQVMEG
jgi:glycosyltransferase involved in cell wall biosynthesis